MEFMSSSRSHDLLGTCSPAVATLTRSLGKVGGGVLLGLIFAGYLPLASQGPYPIIVYSVANYTPLLNRFWAKTYFSRSQLSHFLICINLILNKEHLLFTYSTNILVCLPNVNLELSYPKNQQMCNPILLTLLKMWPHYSQSGHENVTPSSSTSLLPSYKEVPPSPPGTRPCSTLMWGPVSWGVGWGYKCHYFEL